MDIKYHGIDHEVLSDSPFIGALIKASSCKRGCKGCINEHLKKLIPKENNEEEIIQEVKSNKLNCGIILGGLEWSESPNETLSLVLEAFKNNLDVMIYTHNLEKEYIKKVDLKKMISESKKNNKKFYVKYGEFLKNKKVDDNIQFGVKLATSNQYIKQYN